MTVKEGWRGRFFEDFEVGDIYEHPLGRAITTTDNIWFTLLAQNTAPVHVTRVFSVSLFGKSMLGRRQLSWGHNDHKRRGNPWHDFGRTLPLFDDPSTTWR